MYLTLVAQAVGDLVAEYITDTSILNLLHIPIQPTSLIIEEIMELP
jgi:hypothetical protein